MVNTAEECSVPCVLEWGHMTDVSPHRYWADLLSLTAHEVRNGMTVINGYLRMLQGGKAGTLNEQQLRFLELTQRSCAAVTAITHQLSELSRLEEGKREFTRVAVEIHPLLRAAITKLPAMPERDVVIELSMNGAPAVVDGDPVALNTAFTTLFTRLRSELITERRLLVNAQAREHAGNPVTWISVAGEDQMKLLAEATPEMLTPFEHKARSGLGLSLVVAERIFKAHGGALLQKEAGVAKGPVVVMLPRP
jgi:K+-sensing histidine kinase KdpD